MKVVFGAAVILSLNLLICSHAYAGPNDFFGGGNGTPSVNSVAAPGDGSSAASSDFAPAPAGSGPSDYSDDEKRMRRKFKAHMHSAKDLIAKGEDMMKTGQEKHNDKEYKKGKIFKEIGERRMAELKANSPFPELADKPGKTIQ